jgi:pimeloyl-ACP methyl ester carboxylesterase
MSTVDFRGYKIWYRETGSGDPMLFLHNGGNDHRIWDRQVACFSKTNRVIVVDHLGHGQSDCPSIDYTLPLFTGEVAALVDQLNLAPVTLVGHCIGAAMSLNFALAHPEKVHALVLFNVATEATLCAGPLADVYRNFSADRAALDAFVEGIESTGMTREQTNDSLKRQLGASSAADDPEFADHIHRLYNQKGQRATLYNTLAHFETYRGLDQIVRPKNFPLTCLFWGEANAILPSGGAATFRARLNPDRFHLLSGCGHLAMREEPDEVNRTIAEFLATAPREMVQAR